MSIRGEPANLTDEEERELWRVLKLIEKNSRYFTKNIEELRQQYPDEYVAIFDCEVVDHGKFYIPLLERLRKKYIEREFNTIVIEPTSKIDYFYEAPFQVIV